MSQTADTQTVAEAYVTLLARRGVDYFFGNAGTDFAPIIEAFARARAVGRPVPRPVLAGHENLAVTMAHGYAMLARRIPAVMVHVSVGTANMACAALNAARENVPLLLTAGRTPLTEAGLPGSRDGYIHWAQEMYDQESLVREATKWQYELRNGQQLESVVDRALAIASSAPQGPVYLSLPREVIAAPTETAWEIGPSRQRPAAPAAPDPAAVEAAAELLAAAVSPLIVTANAGREAGAFERLSNLADRFAIPVVQHKPRYFALPSSHAMNLGCDPAPLLGEADLILALEADVPWIPVHTKPSPHCKVVQCGNDPLFTQIPIRSFSTDIALAGSTPLILDALIAALGERLSEAMVAERRQRVTRRKADLRAQREACLDEARRQAPLRPEWVSHCLGEAKAVDAVVVNEYTLLPDYCGFEVEDSYFGSSSASGLGWGAGAALGAKLAAPEREVIAVLGDGAYLFSNPVVVHHAAAMHGLPVLFVIMNNAMWGAVRRSTAAMYPGGEAVAPNTLPDFVRLDGLPAFEKVCEAAGGYGERVEDPSALPAALSRALGVVREERRQALLNVTCAAP
jgi:acetolactate synthase I/II/III large subunit